MVALEEGETSSSKFRYNVELNKTNIFSANRTTRRWLLVILVSALVVVSTLRYFVLQFYEDTTILPAKFILDPLLAALVTILILRLIPSIKTKEN